MENILKENMRRFGTKNLSEQEVTSNISTLALPASRRVFKDFVTKYLKEKLPNLTDQLKISKRISILQNFQSQDAVIANTQPIQYFRNLGYKPADAQIRDFQSELGINRIKSKDREGDFVDGDFGAATVKAALQFMIDRLKVTLADRGDKVYADTLASPTERQKAATMPTVIQMPSRRPTNGTQQLNIGTQSTK